MWKWPVFRGGGDGIYTVQTHNFSSEKRKVLQQRLNDSHSLKESKLGRISAPVCLTYLIRLGRYQTVSNSAWTGTEKQKTKAATPPPTPKKNKNTQPTNKKQKNTEKSDVALRGGYRVCECFYTRGRTPKIHVRTIEPYTTTQQRRRRQQQQP